MTTITMQQIEAFSKETIVPAGVRGTVSSLGATRRDMYHIEPTKLRVIEGFNPRVENDDYEAHIRALADSIKTEGFYQDQPLGGYAAKEAGEDVVYIYSGHSRLRAVKIAMAEGAAITHVPVVVSSTGMSMEDMTIALVRGNGGKPLTYYESAVVCQRLQKFGYDLDKIAEHTGFAEGVVRNRLRLMSAPLKLKMMVANGEISPTLALEMFDEYGENVLEKLEEAAETAKDKGKNKVRASSVPDPLKDQDKLIKKKAHFLFEIIKNVKQDSGYMSLTIGNREYIETVLEEIDPPVVQLQNSNTNQPDLPEVGGIW